MCHLAAQHGAGREHRLRQPCGAPAEGLPLRLGDGARGLRLRVGPGQRPGIPARPRDRGAERRAGAGGLGVAEVAAAHPASRARGVPRSGGGGGLLEYPGGRYGHRGVRGGRRAHPAARRGGGVSAAPRRRDRGAYRGGGGKNRHARPHDSGPGRVPGAAHGALSSPGRTRGRHARKDAERSPTDAGDRRRRRAHCGDHVGRAKRSGDNPVDRAAGGRTPPRVPPCGSI